MESGGTKATRILEPFIKISYAMWLIGKGAVKVSISVDGSEHNPEQVADVIVSRGYVREPLSTSTVSWTGRFTCQGRAEILVSSQPGVDISAVFHDRSVLVAECKGEPTPAAIRSGLDRTAFYAAIGQLIIACGNLAAQPQQKVIVLADTSRLQRLASEAAENTLLRQIGLSFALVDSLGNVSEYGLS